MELMTDHARIFFDEAGNTVYFSGSLRSTDPALFEKLSHFLEAACIVNASSMRWDMRPLKDVSSAALGVLYRFVSQRVHQSDYRLIVLANSTIYWQERYLPNIKKILPSAQLAFFQIVEE